ncbi:unnamed protein product, partial [Nesidiocoris tenuis]
MGGNLSSLDPMQVSVPKLEEHLQRDPYLRPHEREFRRREPRPEPPKALKIYECHVGIACAEGRVGTYKEFAENIVPRIKKL